MGYDNSASVPPTPGGYRPPNTYLPQAAPQQQSYESQSSYQVSDNFYGGYSLSSSTSRKKNTRASQVCYHASFDKSTMN